MDEEIIYDPPIQSEEEYHKILERLGAGEKMILERGGFSSEDEKVKEWIKGFERLALRALNWQIDHDLLPL